MSMLKYILETQAVAKQIANSDKTSFSMDDLNLLKKKLSLNDYKYLGWIAKHWDDIKDDESLVDNISKYNKLLNQNANIYNDINKFKTYSEFLSILSNKSSNPTITSVDPSIGKNKLIYDKGNILVYRVLDTKSSIELGNGTSWCTARNDKHNMFCSYTQYGSKFIILNGNMSISNPEHKIGVIRNNGESGYHFHQFQNTENKLIDAEDYLTYWNIPVNIFTYEISEYAQLKKAVIDNNLPFIKSSDIIIDVPLLTYALDRDQTSEEIILLLLDRCKEAYISPSVFNLALKYYDGSKSKLVLDKVFNNFGFFDIDDRSIVYVLKFAKEYFFKFIDKIDINFKIYDTDALTYAIRTKSKQIIDYVYSNIINNNNNRINLVKDSIENCYKIPVLLNRIEDIKYILQMGILPTPDVIRMAVEREHPNIEVIKLLIADRINDFDIWSAVGNDLWLELGYSKPMPKKRQVGKKIHNHNME